MKIGERRSLIGDGGEIVRFIFSGSLGSLLFWLLYELVYWLELVASHNAAFSWSISYIIASLWTHTFHRVLTFHSKAPYLRSLGRTVLVYGCALLLSTAIEDWLVEGVELHHRIAFVLTLTLTGCVNYLVLRNWAFRVNQPNPEPENDHRVHRGHRE